MAAGVLLHQDDILVDDSNSSNGFIQKENNLSEKNGAFHKEKVEKSDEEGEEVV